VAGKAGRSVWDFEAQRFDKRAREAKTLEPAERRPPPTFCTGTVKIVIVRWATIVVNDVLEVLLPSGSVRRGSGCCAEMEYKKI